MPKLQLNDRAIARMTAPDPSGRDILYWDTETRGFGVRCSGKTNSKVFIAQRDLPGGKSRRVNVGPVSLSLETARKRAEDLLDDMRRGIDPKRRVVVPTLQSTLESYLEARKDLAPGTIRMYRTIEGTLKPWINLPLHEITGDMVEAHHREIARSIGKNPTRYTGTATANFAMKTLGILWGFAEIRQPNLPPNPVRRLRRQWYPEPRRERYVKAEQLPAFYNAVLELQSPVARDYILLMLFTGLRRNEAAQLRWTDVDLAEPVIRLPAASTKAKRPLDLPMSDVVWDMLVARRSLGNSGFVFPGRGASRHIQDTEKPFAAIKSATGIEVSAHDLRRTFATVAASSEISPYALKALLNHTLGSDVTSGYIVMTVDALREPVQRVADRMKKLCGIEPLAGGNVAELNRRK